MALIPQQDVIVISGSVADGTFKGGPAMFQQAVTMLHKRLESYPPCRIISISSSESLAGFALFAVIETV